MVRLACGHTVAVRAHLSEGASIIAARCSECQDPEPITIAALADLATHAGSLGVAWVMPYDGGSARWGPPGEGSRGSQAAATPMPAGVSTPSAVADPR